jgi:hypothetical protein
MPGKENADAFSRWEEEKAFSRISSVDKADFDKLDSRLKFAEWIDDPKKEQLGRTIVIRYSSHFEDEEDRKMQSKIVGRSFPLAEDDSRHLVVFKNRRMVIVQPLPPQEDTAESKKKRLQDHKAMFAFKPTELIYEIEPRADIDEQVSTVIDYIWGDALPSMSNDPHDELPTFNTEAVVDKAIALARRLKERREGKFDRDAAFMMKAYEKQFGKVIFPPKDQPPHEQPPTAEPPAI